MATPINFPLTSIPVHVSKKRKPESGFVDSFFSNVPTTPAKILVKQAEQNTPENMKPSLIFNEAILATPLGQDWYKPFHGSELSSASTLDNTNLETPCIDRKHEVKNIRRGVASSLKYGVITHKKKSSGKK